MMYTSCDILFKLNVIGIFEILKTGIFIINFEQISSISIYFCLLERVPVSKGNEVWIAKLLCKLT